MAGKGNVKASVKIQIKGIKYQYPAQEPLRKDGKKEKCCLLDGAMGIVHVKSIGDSWGMESSEESQQDPISS